MYTIPIDEAGYIDNPCFIDKPEPCLQKAWGALVYRRGKKIEIASFLPRDRQGKKIEARGLSQGVYLKFCSATVGGKFCSLYVVDQVTESEISLLSVVGAAVPTIYDIDTIAPTKLHILEAKLEMLEAQMDDLRISISNVKRQPLNLPKGQ